MGFVRSGALPALVTDAMPHDGWHARRHDDAELSLREYDSDPAGKHRRNLQRSGMGHKLVTASAQRHPLPKLPKGLSWPKDFDKALEFGRHPKMPGGVVAYLRREWAKIIAAGNLIDMPTLWENFPYTARAINTYTKPHPKTGERRTLPKKLTIPITKEVNTQKMLRAMAGKEVVSREERTRLDAVVRWRMKNWPHAST